MLNNPLYNVLRLRVHTTRIDTLYVSFISAKHYIRCDVVYHNVSLQREVLRKFTPQK